MSGLFRRRRCGFGMGALLRRCSNARNASGVILHCGRADMWVATLTASNSPRRMNARTFATPIFRRCETSRTLKPAWQVTRARDCADASVGIGHLLSLREWRAPAVFDFNPQPLQFLLRACGLGKFATVEVLL